MTLYLLKAVRPLEPGVGNKSCLDDIAVAFTGLYFFCFVVVWIFSEESIRYLRFFLISFL